MKMTQNAAHVGIDVSKAELVIYIDLHKESLKLPNLPGGWADLLARLRQIKPVLVVIEATGGYEKGVSDFLRKAEIKVWVVDPRRVRQFARASGRRAKTDPIDARMIAHFGATYADEYPDTAPISAELETLKNHIAYRHQLVEARLVITNQQRLLKDQMLRKLNDDRIELIDKQKKTRRVSD